MNWLCIRCTESLFPFNHFDDNSDFLDTISESNIPLDNLRQKVLNPFQFNKDRRNMPLDDIDPDLQFFNDMMVGNAFNNSDYFS